MPQSARVRITPRRWLEYLAAILIGNAIYFFSLYPHLSGTWQHNLYHVDAGLLLDFATCAAVYGLIRVASRL